MMWICCKRLSPTACKFRYFSVRDRSRDIAAAAAAGGAGGAAAARSTSWSIHTIPGGSQDTKQYSAFFSLQRARLQQDGSNSEDDQQHRESSCHDSNSQSQERLETGSFDPQQEEDQESPFRVMAPVHSEEAIDNLDLNAAEDNDENVLIEATLVGDRSRNNLGSRQVFYEAKPVEPKEMLMHLLRRKTGIAAMACCLLATLGLILGLVLGLKDRDNDNMGLVAIPTTAPSMAPIQAPTVEFTRDLLPNFAIDAIDRDPESPQEIGRAHV